MVPPPSSAILQTQSVGPQAFNQVVGYRRLDELSEKLKPFAFRIKKEECLDLPEKVYSLRYVDLTDEQEEAYKSMKKLALAMLEDGSITTTASALTQILRLQSEDRAHRIGQTKSVNYIDLISQFPSIPGEKVMNTIDQRIVEALKDKIDIASKVLGEELKKWLI